MTDATFEQLVNIVSEQFKQINTLRSQYEDLDMMYKELSDDYCNLQLEKLELERILNGGLDESLFNDSSDSGIQAVPVNEMAITKPTEEPTKGDGIFPTPASAVHSMVTGTTDQKCHCLTTVLKELEPDPTTSRRILIAQKLFEYRKDENGKNRLMPTDWFKEYGISHGIIAEFTGHTSTKKGPKTFSWYKITEEGKDIIKGTAMGEIVWKYFAGPGCDDDDCCGYFPVPASQD